MRVLLIVLAIVYTLYANYETSMESRFAPSVRKTNLTPMVTTDAYTSFVKLQNMSSKLAVIRGDILSNINMGTNGFKRYNSYSVLAKLDDSIFYLVSKNTINSIYDLRNKVVAIGAQGNIAGKYLMNIAQKAGVSSDINVKALDENIALDALKKGQIDAIFVMSSRTYHDTIVQNGFKPTPLPNDFLKVLLTQSGFYDVKNKAIATVKSDNYLIASNDLTSTDLEAIVIALKSANIIPLSIVDATFGNANPYINEVLAKTQQTPPEAPAPAQTPAPKVVASAPAPKATTPTPAPTPPAEVKPLFETKIIENTKENNMQKVTYQLSNNDTKTLTLDFVDYKTTSFDNFPYKARHFFKISQTKIVIEPNTSKVVTLEFQKAYPIDIVSGSLIFKDSEKNIKEINFKVNEQ